MNRERIIEMFISVTALGHATREEPSIWCYDMVNFLIHRVKIT